MKFKNKLKKHVKEGIITLAIAGITGLFAVANAHVEKYKESQAYYTESECVVLTADEVNNIAFKEVADYLINNHTNISNSYLIYNNTNYVIEDFGGDSLDYANNGNINFQLNEDIVQKGEFFDNTDTRLNAQYTLYWYGEDIVNAFKESTITLTPTQLNDTTYSYLGQQIEDNYSNQLANSVIEYNGYIAEFTSEDPNHNTIAWQFTADDSFIYYIEFDNYYKYFNLYSNETDENLPFIDSITIFNASYIVDNINAPFETDDIIPAISGGLTLIGDLANQFLTGFSTLFWDSVGNKLTNFGIYSLTMLGIAITFAVIKLCLNVLRRDTGA